MEFSPTATDYLFLLAFALLFLLSGAVTSVWAFRQKRESPVKGSHASETRPARGALGNLSCLESVLFILMNAIVVTSFVLLVTAQLGVFRIRHWLFILLAYDLLLVFHLRLWRRDHWPVRSPWLWPEKCDWLLLPLCLLAAYTFYRPSESIHTRDPGGYVNIAVKLSDTGSLKFNDPDFRQFDSKIRQSLFLRVPLNQSPYPQALPGFQLLDPAAGTLVPRYFHLFPLWLTLCFKLWRFSGVFALNAFLGIMSVLILIPLGQRLFASKLVGWFAAFLLTVNLAQIWIVRSPFSEILAQVFLLGGIWALSVAMTEKWKGTSVLSGLLLGLFLFVRVDSVIALVAIVFFAMVMMSISKNPSTSLASASPPRPFSVPPFRAPTPLESPLGKGGTISNGGSFPLSREFFHGFRRDSTEISFPLLPFLFPLGLVSAYTLLHTCIFAYPYVWNVIDTFGKLSRSIWQLILFSGVVVGLAFLITVWQRARLAEALRRDVNRQRLLIGAVLLLSLLFIYAYFFRPAPGSA